MFCEGMGGIGRGMGRTGLNKIESDGGVVFDFGVRRIGEISSFY